VLYARLGQWVMRVAYCLDKRSLGRLL